MRFVKVLGDGSAVEVGPRQIMRSLNVSFDPDQVTPEVIAELLLDTPFFTLEDPGAPDGGHGGRTIELVSDQWTVAYAPIPPDEVKREGRGGVLRGYREAIGAGVVVSLGGKNAYWVPTNAGAMHALEAVIATGGAQPFMVFPVNTRGKTVDVDVRQLPVDRLEMLLSYAQTHIAQCNEALAIAVRRVEQGQDANFKQTLADKTGNAENLTDYPNGPGSKIAESYSTL